MPSSNRNRIPGLPEEEEEFDETSLEEDDPQKYQLDPQTQAAFDRVADAQREMDLRAQEIPDLPKPSIWRKLAAAGVGAIGGYWGDRIDPRLTESATRGILEGNYGERRQLAADRLEAAQRRMQMANMAAGQAGVRQNALDTLANRRMMAKERNDLRRSQIAAQRAAANERVAAQLAAQGGRLLTPEEIDSEDVKSAVQSGMVLATRVGDQTWLVPSIKGRSQARQTAEFNEGEQAVLSKLLQDRGVLDKGQPMPASMTRNTVQMILGGMREIGDDRQATARLEAASRRLDGKRSELENQRDARLMEQEKAAYVKRQQTRELEMARQLKAVETNPVLDKGARDAEVATIKARYEAMGKQDNSETMDRLSQLAGRDLSAAKWQNKEGKGGDPTPKSGAGKVADDQTFARYVNEANGDLNKAMERLAKDGYRVN